MHEIRPAESFKNEATYRLGPIYSEPADVNNLKVK
jgi:hypothetical protein